MNILTIIASAIINFISFVFARVMAPYQKTSKLKYVSLKSDFLSKLLIPKSSGYVKVNDRKKISLFSLVFYILFTILVIVLLIMLLLPDIPCEPFVAHFGKRGKIEWTINTLNEKLIFLLPFIFFMIELIAFLAPRLPMIIKSKTETKKSKAGFIAVFAVFIVLLVFFIYQLF